MHRVPFLILLAFPACSVPPGISPVEKQIDPWWTAWGNAPLSSMLEYGMEQNGNVLASAERVLAARARAASAGSFLQPQLAGGAQASRGAQKVFGFPLPGGPDPLAIRSNSHALNWSASWEVDLWGRLDANRRAAVAGARASEADHAAAQLSLSGQLAKQFYAQREAFFLLANAQEILRLAESRVVQGQKRYEAGTLPQEAITGAKIAFEDALLSANSLQRLYSQACDRILALSGADPDGFYPATGHAPFKFSPLPPLPEKIEAQQIAARPDLAALEARYLAAQAGHESTRAALYPRISLSSSAGTNADQLANLTNPDFGVWNLAANLSAPILDGGRLRAEEMAAAAEERALGHALAQAIRQSLWEARGLLQDDASLAGDLRTAQRKLEARRQEAYRFRELWVLGLSNFEEMVTAEQLNFAASSAAMRIHFQRIQNRIDLHLALGGDPLFSESSTP